MSYYEPLEKKGNCDACDKKRKLWKCSLTGGDFLLCKKCAEDTLK